MKDDAGAAKGTITYIYDAAGNKLEKRVEELPAAGNNQTVKNTYTSYLAGHVYENNVLQFFSHEEGRIRPQRNSAGVATGVYYYDYFIKDHLGNTRMVLTDEKQIDAYPVASLEATTINSEKTYYDIPDASRIATSEVPGYPVSGTSNAWVQRLNGNGQKTGTSIVLRVMSGDKVSISADSWYASGVTPGTPSNLSVADLIASLAGGIAGSGGASHSVAQVQQNPNLQGGLGSFLTNVVNADNAANGNLPKSYLNYVLFDEQLNVVITNDGKNSGIDRVGSGGELKSHQITQRPITRNGYLYIYVSNETPGLNVIFDNLKVTHVRGELAEETHYYPFGLTMAGISSKAAGKLENKRRYNGIEFNDEFDIDTYDAFYRNLDPQLGRWLQIDPKVDSLYAWGVYTSMFDNPVLKIDPLGDFPDGPGAGAYTSRALKTLIRAQQVAGAIVAVGAGNPVSDAAGVVVEVVGAAIAVGQLSQDYIQYKKEGVVVSEADLKVFQNLAQANTLNAELHESYLLMAQGHCGGKNGQHANQKRRDAAQERYENVRKEYDALKTKANKTPDEKKELQKLERQMKHEKQRVDNTGENHSRKAKGSN